MSTVVKFGVSDTREATMHDGKYYGFVGVQPPIPDIPPPVDTAVYIGYTIDINSNPYKIGYGKVQGTTFIDIASIEYSSDADIAVPLYTRDSTLFALASYSNTETSGATVAGVKALGIVGSALIEKHQYTYNTLPFNFYKDLVMLSNGNLLVWGYRDTDNRGLLEELSYSDALGFQIVTQLNTSDYFHDRWLCDHNGTVIMAREGTGINFFLEAYSRSAGAFTLIATFPSNITPTNYLYSDGNYIYTGGGQIFTFDGTAFSLVAQRTVLTTDTRFNVEGDKYVVIHTGASTTTNYVDVYRFDGSSLVLLKSNEIATPLNRYFKNFGGNLKDGKLYVFGGTGYPPEQSGVLTIGDDGTVVKSGNLTIPSTNDPTYVIANIVPKIV